MKNNVLVEMLEAEGFTAFEDENDPAQRMQEFCNAAGHLDGLVRLRRDFKFATGDVALRKESVDRNFLSPSKTRASQGRSPLGERG